MSSFLVNVVKIKEISEHPNADRLEVVHVDGWRCVIQKGQFKVGDVAIFVPIDSVLPGSLIEECGLTYLRKGERVATVRLRGVVSQGILLENKWGFKLRENVANSLGITKWEPPVKPHTTPSRQLSKKELNPRFFKYMDIENIKNYPNLFEEGEEVVITCKLHGSSARHGWVQYSPGGWRKWKIVQKLFPGLIPTHEFIVGSRNVQLVSAANKKLLYYDTNIYERVAESLGLAYIIPSEYVVYSEIVGPGVQDLTYGLKHGQLGMYAYDVRYKGEYLPYDEFLGFCKDIGLLTVPELYRGPYSAEKVAELTDGKSAIAPNQIREGVVVKSTSEVPHKHFGRKVLKSISVDYLLRKDGTEYH